MNALRPPPRHAPRRLDSTEDLRRLQRLMTHAIVRPLAAGDRSPAKWTDGRPTKAVVEEFIKPNDRLTAMERLEIYHRVYWYRIMGAALEDSPGLRALLGEKKCERLLRAYLAKFPSRSFTMRNLCSRLPEFVRTNPRLCRPHARAAQAVARFEWAQTVAFDSAAKPALSARAIQGTPPGRLKAALQPYLTLLDLPFRVDEFVLAVKKRDALRAEASNTSEAAPHAGSRRRARRPALRKLRTYLAVHRFQNQLYYKQLEPAEYRILEALQRGATVARALAAGGRRVRPEDVQRWFATWMKLRWLCRRE